MPRELVAAAIRTPELRSYEDTPLEPDQVRARTEYGAPKHGTELHMYRGDSPFGDSRFDPAMRAFLPGAVPGGGFPMSLGNIAVGTVTEVGASVRDVQPGDRIAGYAPLRETQTWTWGAVSVYPRVRAMPAGMSWQNALCLDPATVALGGVRDGGVRIGDRVLVAGLGAIGLLAVQLCKVAGASFVAAIDPIAARRQVAEATGADLVLDPTAVDAGIEVRRAATAAGGVPGVDVVIETSGNARALQAGIRALAFGGTVAVVGWYNEIRGGLDLGREAHFNRPRLVFPRVESEPHYDHPRWTGRRLGDAAWELLANGRLDCTRVIQPVVPFDESPAAYREYVDEHPERSVKLGVRFT